METYLRKYLRSGRPRADTGNATAEFVMVTSLVILLFAVVLQVAFAIYTKNIVTDAASSGARYGALLDRTPQDGAARTQQMIESSLPSAYLSSVSAEETVIDGMPVVEVRVEGTLPVLGPLGFNEGITVVGHAIKQQQ